MGLLNSILHIHEYGKLDENGYQHCKTCNKANFVGLPYVQPNWEIMEKYEFTNKQSKIRKITYVQKCTVTGELKSFSVKSKW